MNNRWFVGCVIVAPLVALAQSAPATSAQAGPSSFHYVDESSRLPPDTNPPDTDTLDVDFVDVDGDGDLDLVVGNSTSIGGAESLYLRRNSPGKQ